MIPRHSLSRDNSGNGVSCRVEACRKRLRTIRTNKKPQLKTENPAQSEDIDMVGGLEPGSTGMRAVLEAQTESGGGLLS